MRHSGKGLSPQPATLYLMTEESYRKPDCMGSSFLQLLGSRSPSIGRCVPLCAIPFALCPFCLQPATRNAQPETRTPIRLLSLRRFKSVSVSLTSMKIALQGGEEYLDVSFFPSPENFLQRNVRIPCRAAQVLSQGIQTA